MLEEENVFPSPRSPPAGRIITQMKEASHLFICRRFQTTLQLSGVLVDRRPGGMFVNCFERKHLFLEPGTQQNRFSLLEKRWKDADILEFTSATAWTSSATDLFSFSQIFWMWNLCRKDWSHVNFSPWIFYTSLNIFVPGEATITILQHKIPGCEVICTWKLTPEYLKQNKYIKTSFMVFCCPSPSFPENAFSVVFVLGCFLKHILRS